MVEAKDRLKKLMEQRGVTNRQLGDLCGVAEETVRGYKKGNGVPLDVAIKIADTYGVTLDWLFGRSEYQNETDLMVDIVLALDKVFRFTTIKDASGCEWPVLQIDRNFYEYITDLQRLQRLKETSSMIEKEYVNVRRGIYEKYKTLLNEIFNADGFNENAAIQIRDFEGLTIVDIFANATERKKGILK